MSVLGIVLLFFVQSNAFRIQGGEFLQTKMFQEPETCQHTVFYNHLKTVLSVSPLQCGLTCLNTPDCRRIMFDRKTKICSMFESGEDCFHHENIEDKVCYRLKSICSELNCTRCPMGYYGDTCQHILQDCSDGSTRGIGKETSHLSYIQPTENGTVIEVKCQFGWDGLTYIQHRDGNCLETDFNRSWDEYEHGFGNKHAEYWLGLQHIYDILQNHNNFELSILVKAGSVSYQGKFKNFSLSNSNENFKFHTAKFTGYTKYPLGDSLTNGTYSIEGRPFSTYDRDYSHNNCPNRFKGGWWYLDDPECSRANPNGRRKDSNDEAMIQWLDNLGYRNDIHQVRMRLRRIYA